MQKRERENGSAAIPDAKRPRPPPAVEQLQQALSHAEHDKLAALGLQAALFAAETRRLSRLVEQTVRQQPPGHPLALPDGWLGCPAVGALFDVGDGLLLPCKVPLGACTRLPRTACSVRSRAAVQAVGSQTCCPRRQAPCRVMLR
jgi:hypothetical protein